MVTPCLSWIAGTVVVLAATWAWLSGDGFDPALVRGRRVLITGASSGIGEQLAYRYARLGAKLILAARREHLLKTVATRCGELGAAQVSYVVADLAINDDRAALVARTLERLGGLDHLVLNHAVLRNDWWQGTVENVTDLCQDLDVNFFSFTDLASRALPALAESRGAIAIVSSLGGKMGTARSATYSATKFALHGFFSSWRLELQFRRLGVSITLCVLGPVATQRAEDLLKASYPHLTFEGIGAPPAEVADAIVRGVTTRQPEICHDWRACLIMRLHTWMPNVAENTATRFLLN